MPGISGILQGKHNLLIHLKHIPDAHNMRLILDSQRIVSHEAATRVGTTLPALADKWDTLPETFTALLHQTRNVRGLLGDGGPAAAQGVLVAACHCLSRSLEPEPEPEGLSMQVAGGAAARVGSWPSLLLPH